MRIKWRHGDRVKLADLAGISKQHLNNILTARRRAIPETADRLWKAAVALGLPLERDDFMFPYESKNPLILAYRNRG